PRKLHEKADVQVARLALTFDALASQTNHLPTLGVLGHGQGDRTGWRRHRHLAAVVRFGNSDGQIEGEIEPVPSEVGMRSHAHREHEVASGATEGPLAALAGN